MATERTESDNVRRDFGTLGLQIGDELHGPRGSVGIVGSGGGGTLVRMVSPKSEFEHGLYQLKLATRLLLKIPRETQFDPFEYWTYQGTRLSDMPLISGDETYE